MAADIIPIKNLYFLLCYAWDLLPEAELVPVDWESSPDATALFAHVLGDGVRKLLRRGLSRDYILERDCGSRIRGKVLLSESIRDLSFMSAKAHCEYDDLSLQNPENMILRHTLGVLARCVKDKTLRQQLGFLYHQLAPIEDRAPIGTVSSALFGRRLSPFYCFLLNVCEFVLEELLPNETKGEYCFRDFIREERRMPRLFERFVCNFYKREQSEFQVKGQKRIPWRGVGIDQQSSDFLPEMIVDVLLQRTDSDVLIETKFYKDPLPKGRFGKAKVRSSHLYQINTYLEHMGHDQAAGILLYPTIHNDFHFQYRLGRYDVAVCSVNLADAWPDIKDRLLSLVR